MIFDMDGVLVLSEEAHWESWRQVAERRGVGLAREVFLASFGQTNADCIPAMFGATTPAAEIERIADEKERTYRDIVREGVPLAPGLFDLLDQLRSAGARFAVGSSAPPENVDLVLDAGGLREFFSVSVNGNQVSRGKPAPDVFLVAAEKLGLAPGHCSVIEDAPAGIAAARAAGMRAVGVATTHAADALLEAGADVVAADLAALDPALVLGPL
ncbi:MAG: HAD family phosphatase [Planctomycetota bacterium]|nr:HAD family phosphatase [Planctomycetota bacterium]